MTRRLGIDRMAALFVAEYHRYDYSVPMAKWRADTLQLWRDFGKDQLHPYRDAYRRAVQQIEQEQA